MMMHCIIDALTWEPLWRRHRRATWRRPRSRPGQPGRTLGGSGRDYMGMDNVDMRRRESRSDKRGAFYIAFMRAHKVQEANCAPITDYHIESLIISNPTTTTANMTSRAVEQGKAVTAVLCLLQLLMFQIL